MIDWEDALEFGRPSAEFPGQQPAWRSFGLLGSEAMGDFTCMYQAMMEIDYTHLPYWNLLGSPETRGETEALGGFLPNQQKKSRLH